MRIGLIYEKFVWGGGLEQYSVSLARALLERGHEVEVITRLTDETTQAMPLKLHVLPTAKWSGFYKMAYFNQDATWFTRACGFDRSIGLGRTVEQDIHRAGGGCHKVYSTLLSPWKQLSLKNRLELSLEKQLYTLGKTRRFVVNSSLVARQLQECYGVAADRLTVIHTAVDTTRYCPAENRAELKAGLCQEIGADSCRPALLFVSLGHWRKGLDAALEALLKTDADLWIAGSPLKGYASIIRKFGLSRRVFYLGRDRDLVPLYQAADWFIHPTRYDACANTVLQSMACGLPGLISVADGAVDHVRDRENGLLLQNPSSIAAEVTAALKMPEDQRLAMGRSARAAMLPLAWESHAAHWEKLLQTS